MVHCSYNNTSSQIILIKASVGLSELYCKLQSRHTPTEIQTPVHILQSLCRKNSNWLQQENTVWITEGNYLKCLGDDTESNKPIQVERFFS